MIISDKYTKAYIYIIKIDGDVRYVGQTTNFKNRIMSHNCSIRNKDCPMYNLMKFNSVEYIQVKEINSVDITNEEDSMVVYYLELGCILFNKHLDRIKKRNLEFKKQK